MKCIRCGGLMVGDRCFQEDPPEVAMVNRCLNCGEVVDSTILVNRQACPPFSWDFTSREIWKELQVPYQLAEDYNNAA